MSAFQKVWGRADMPHDRAMKLSCEAAGYWGLADRSHTKTRYAYDARRAKALRRESEAAGELKIDGATDCHRLLHFSRLQRIVLTIGTASKLILNFSSSGLSDLLKSSISSPSGAKSVR
jgi:hypothetical protein